MMHGKPLVTHVGILHMVMGRCTAAIMSFKRNQDMHNDGKRLSKSSLFLISAIIAFWAKMWGIPTVAGSTRLYGIQ